MLIPISALSRDVVYNFDDSVDFSKFKTYKWVTLEKVAPIDELTDEQIKAALDAALAGKGFTKVSGDSAADLFIGYQTTEQIQEQFGGPTSGWGVGPGWNGRSDSVRTIYKGRWRWTCTILPTIT